MNKDKIKQDEQEAPTPEATTDEAQPAPARRRRRVTKENKRVIERLDEEMQDELEREKVSSRELMFLKELERRQRDDDDDKVHIPAILPVLPLKDMVVFPFAVQPLGVGQDRSIRLIDAVMRGNRLVVLVAQKSADIELAGPNDIFKVGTVSRIARMIRMPDGTLQIIEIGRAHV